MTGQIVNTEVLNFVGSDVRNEADRHVLTIGRQRCGLQQRRGVGIRLTIVDIDPTSKEPVGWN